MIITGSGVLKIQLNQGRAKQDSGDRSFPEGSVIFGHIYIHTGKVPLSYMALLKICIEFIYDLYIQSYMSSHMATYMS